MRPMSVTKKEIKRMPKQILDKINIEIFEKLRVNKWKSLYM